MDGWPDPGPGPNLDMMVAALLTETGLSLLDLPHLTDRQVHALYYHPRDRDGRVSSSYDTGAVLPDRDDPITELEAARIHFGMGQALGIPRADLERTWLSKYASIPEGV